MQRKLTMTPARLAANRANAQKSRGPLTEQGKRISAQNARPKHGLRSRNPRLSRTDESFISRIYALLEREHRPVTGQEVAAVREVAVSKWNSDRTSRIFDDAIAHANSPASANRLRGLYRHAAAADNRLFRAISALIDIKAARAQTHEIAPANPLLPSR